MAYKIRPARPLDAEFRKVALAQIDRALADLRGEDGDLHEAIHEARKRLKKLRGLVRLIRPADDDLYADLNAAFRDGARGLSGVRDKAALIEALDDLETHFAGQLKAGSLRSVRAKLVADRDAAVELDSDAASIRNAVLAMEQARPRIEAFQIGGGRHDAKKAGRIVARGAAKTFERARDALAIAAKSRDAEDLHDLRKRVKYHWMHLRLLAPAWPEAFGAPIDLAKSIADDLGRDHDFAVLRGEVRADPDAFGDEETLSLLIALIDRRQSELREAGIAGARRLLVETGDSFSRRIARLYRLAADEGEKNGDAMPAEPPKADRRVA
ncbi:CHAD domain-containing protein [Jiella mangrovi]|uniref:CHAD domain-containing protein n=1 Tax=Jiella mangrovi TaxID=2821407 RepID=A0ABS4BPC5_9HYPH|nr:CHAD domain-containing protein [Jiella mangrovi]MBP0618049.1 CHAD domain-containing protein [Jiella mangrovi]